MPPYNQPYVPVQRRRPYPAPLAVSGPSAAPAAPQSTDTGFLDGFMSNADQFRQANPGVISAFGDDLLRAGGSRMAGGETSQLMAQNGNRQQIAQYLVGQGIAKDLNEGMLLASNPTLLSSKFKTNTVADAAATRAKIADQLGLRPDDPTRSRYIATGNWPADTSNRGRYIAIGNGMVMDTNSGNIVQPGGSLGGASTDPNDAPILEPGQRDEAYLQTLDPGTREIVKGLTNYQLDLSKVSSVRGNQRMQLAAAAKRYDPSFDMTQYGARAAMRKSMTSGDYAKSINSANLVIQHLDALDKSYSGLNNGSYPWLNSVENVYANNTGNEKFQAARGSFDSAADAVASELAKVFKGSGGTAEAEVQAWRENISPNMPPAAFKASVQTLIKSLLASRLDTIHSQFTSAMGKPADFTILTPHSKQILQNLGIDPTEMEQGGGSPIDVPDPMAPAPRQDTSSGGWTDLGNGVRIRQKP
jgi:hypothetical protein